MRAIAKKSMRKTSNFDNKRRSRQTKSKGANSAAADLESETMEIALAVNALMAAAEEGGDVSSCVDSKSHAEDGMSCADYDDEEDDEDGNSEYESDDDSNQDDDEEEDESSRESDSDDDEESNDESEVETAEDTKPWSSRRLGRRGRSAGQPSRMSKSKKWGLKRLLGSKQRADTKAIALKGNDDDLSSSSPASASDFTRSQSRVSSVMRDIDHAILGGDTTEDNTICTAGRVSIVEDVSTAAGNDGDEESTVAFEISTTFPNATSFIRSLGLGPKVLGYDSSANNDEGEEEGGAIKDKNGKHLDVIKEDEAGDTHNSPTGTSPLLSITVSQSTDNDDRVGTTSNANLNASFAIAPLTPSDRTASECRQPVGSPEKITVRREESDLSLGNLPTPKRMPFKSLVGRKPAKAPESPPKRKPRRDHVIVSVFSNDSAPSNPTIASSSNPFGACANTSSKDAWYNCSSGACTADMNNDIAVASTSEDDVAWTANFDEAFGTTKPDDQKNAGQDANANVEDTRPTSSDGSLPSNGTDGPALNQTTPSTPLNRKSKDLPPSPTSVIPAIDGKDTNKEAQKNEQDYVSEDLKKQVNELDQLISKMSYDMKLLSSIISEQKQKEQRTTRPVSPEIGGSVRHRSLVDDIVDDIDEKAESNKITAYAVDSGVEVPLDNSKFVTPSEDVGIDKPSVGPIVATESVPVTATTDRAGDFQTKHDEMKKKQTSKFLSKLFKGKKNTKSPPRPKNLSSPPRTKRSVLSFRRSNKPQASMGADDSNVVDAELSAADTAMLPVTEKSETFGDAILSSANALLDQAADYAFPPEEDDKAKLVEGKKGLKLKKKKKDKAKEKKSPSKLIKSKSKSKSQRMTRSSSKKRAVFSSKHENDRSERVCRIFGDCADLYNDICNYQELSCMCQDFLCDAQDEATLAVCRVDYAVKKSIRNFGEQCIAVADGEEDESKSQKSRRSKR